MVSPEFNARQYSYLADDFPSVRPTASFPRALFLPEIPDVDHKTIPRRLGTIGPRVVATSPAGPDRLCRGHGQSGQGHGDRAAVVQPPRLSRP